MMMNSPPDPLSCKQKRGKPRWIDTVCIETFHKSLKYSHSGFSKQCEKKAAKLQSDRAAKLKDNAQREKQKYLSEPRMIGIIRINRMKRSVTLCIITG